MFIKSIIAKITVWLVTLLSVYNISLPLIPENKAPYQCANVFVHGLYGWGESDERYEKLPYWGMLGGDLMVNLRAKGYECYAASVNPRGSVWDRTCELYAQLAGVRTDYGEAHSKKYGHDRYGKDYSNEPLMEKPWSTENRINIFGHSLGGANARLLVSLLETGSEEEKAVTKDGSLSPLFEGGNSNLVHAVVSLSSPHNGSTAFESGKWAPQGNSIKDKFLQFCEENDYTRKFFQDRINGVSDENGIYPDTAFYDLTIDGAMLVNQDITASNDVWYFSAAANCTTKQPNGTWFPNPVISEIFLLTRSIGMGKTTFITPGGFVVDEKWFPNDGIVNTVSAHYPFGEPHCNYKMGNKVSEKGVWNVLPDVVGNHMYYAGGLPAPKDVSEFYYDILKVLDNLE